MMQTLEAIIDKNGKVRLLENVRLPRERRALLTILDDEPKQIKSKIRLSNRELSDALNEAYKDEPTAEEREELRLMKNKSFEALDEWK